MRFSINYFRQLQAILVIFWGLSILSSCSLLGSKENFRGPAASTNLTVDVQDCQAGREPSQLNLAIKYDLYDRWVQIGQLEPEGVFSDFLQVSPCDRNSLNFDLQKKVLSCRGIKIGHVRELKTLSGYDGKKIGKLVLSEQMNIRIFGSCRKTLSIEFWPSLLSSLKFKNSPRFQNKSEKRGVAAYENLLPIDSCLNQPSRLNEIEQVIANQTTDGSASLPLTNETGERVGIVVFESKELMLPQAMYLCGRNSGYYYIKNVKMYDWLGISGQTKKLKSIFNDEYDIDGSVITKKIESGLMKLHFNIHITPIDPQSADYPETKGQFFMNWAG